jgi:hypothetical protein
MAGYPRIDKANPYLTSRYDGGIVDSLPWGHGWLADGQQVRTCVAGSSVAAAVGTAVARAQRDATAHSHPGLTKDLHLRRVTRVRVQVAAPIVAPARVGLVGRMAAASDGPRMPIPDTTWVTATTGECLVLHLCATCAATAVSRRGFCWHRAPAPSRTG